MASTRTSLSPSDPAPASAAAPSSPLDRRNALLRVTHHEASHAVACVVLDIPFDHVTVIPNRDTTGGLAFTADGQPVETSDLSAEAKREYARRRGIVDLAGRIGEAIVSGEWDTAGAAGDLEDLQECLGEIATTPSERILMRRELDAAARELVGNNWSAIERVASMLEAEKTLTSQRVADLVAA